MKIAYYIIAWISIFVATNLLQQNMQFCITIAHKSRKNDSILRGYTKIIGCYKSFLIQAITLFIALLYLKVMNKVNQKIDNSKQNKYCYKN